MASFLNGLELFYLYASIGIVSPLLNGSKYSYQTLINLFNIDHLFVDSHMATDLGILD